MKALSLPIAVINLLLAATAGLPMFVIVVIWVACCLPMIWRSEQMARWDGLFYVSAITGESRKSIVLQMGWIFLAVPGVMILASLLLRG